MAAGATVAAMVEEETVAGEIPGAEATRETWYVSATRAAESYLDDSMQPAV